MTDPYNDWPKSRSRLPDRSLERSAEDNVRPAQPELPMKDPARFDELIDSHDVAERSVEERDGARGGKLQKVLLIVALCGLLGLILAVFSIVYVVDHYSAGLPDVKRLQNNYAPPQVTRVYARDGTVLSNIFSERRTVVPFSRVPDHVKSAFLAAEDARFFEHEGLNYLGLMRAMAVNLKRGEVRQGGSTITQQVVKNVLLDHERSYKRKIRETILAYRLEKTLSKEQILGMYLNHIYLGHGRYGVEEAGRYYFGKHVEELNVAEAALLSGIVAAPEHFSPRKDEKKALMRRDYVLAQMRDKGFMTGAVYDAAMKMPVRLAPVAETESDIAPELVLHAKRELTALFGDEAKRGGFAVHTTIDPALQVAARTALRKGLDDYLTRQKLKPPFTLQQRKLWGKIFEGTPRRYGIYTGQVVERNDKAGTIRVKVGTVEGVVHVYNETRYNATHIAPTEFVGPGAALRVQILDDPAAATAEQPVRMRLELGPQGALIALDPTTGHVLSAVGSYEALPGTLDRSFQTKRQPGSTFKPLVYSLALSNHQVTAATHFEFPLVEKIEVDGVKMERSTIQRLSLRQGVATSDNRVALDVYNRVGGQAAVSWAQKMGVTSKLGPTESLMLGAYEVSVAEMATAYGVFASGGVFRPAQFITKVESGAGPVPRDKQVPESRVMDAGVAFLMTDILTSVVEEGTATFARSLKRPLAGKTGTTNQAKDAWFVGFSTDVVVAVWVGFDDALPLGWGESGAKAALPIWTSFMQAAHEGKAATEFPRPSDIVDVELDPQSGLLARYGQEDTIREIFLRGTEPQDIAPEPQQANTEEVQAPDANETATGVDGDLVEGTASASDELPPPPPPPPIINPELDEDL